MSNEKPNYELPKIDNKEQIAKSVKAEWVQKDMLTISLAKEYADQKNQDMEASHDANVFVYKYLDWKYQNGKLKIDAKANVTVEEITKNLADIRNALGKDFYDNMLYKYDVPYEEIVCLAEELKSADTNRINAMKKDLLQLLDNMGDWADNLTPTVQNANEVQKAPEKQVTAEEVQMLSTLFGEDVRIFFPQLNLPSDQKIKNKKEYKMTNLNDQQKERLKNVLLPELWSVLMHIMFMFEDGSRKYEWYNEQDFQKYWIPKTDEWRAKFTQVVKSFQDVAKELKIDEQWWRKQAADRLIARLTSEGKTISDKQKNLLYGKQDWNKLNANNTAWLSKLDITSLITLKSIYDEAGKTTQWEKNENFFEKQHNTFVNSMLSEFTRLQKPKLCTPEAADRLSLSMMRRWYGKVEAHIDAYNTGKPNDQKASKDQISGWLNMSPFNQKHRDALWVKENFPQLMQNLSEAQDKTWKPLESLAQVPDLMNMSTGVLFFADVKSYQKLSTPLQFAIDPTYKTDVIPEGDKNLLQERLQSVVEAFEAWRKLSDTERMVNAAAPVFDQFAKGVDSVATFLDGFVENLKKTGVREKIEKVWNLLFWSGSVLDRVSKFHQMKETKITPSESVALDQGMDMLKGALPDADPQKPWTIDDAHAEDVKKALNTQLFPEKAFDTTPDDTEWDRKMQIKSSGTTMYADLMKAAGSTDLPDLMMRKMCKIGKSGEDKQAYDAFVSHRENNPWEAKKLFDVKFATVFDARKKESLAANGNLWPKPYETLAKSVLTSLLDSDEAGQKMVKLPSTAAQKDLDAKGVELQTFTKDIVMRQDPNWTKLYLDGVPKDTKAEITVWGKTVEYTDAGIDLSLLWPDKKFTLAKKWWWPLVKLENISVATPKVEKSADSKSFGITWLTDDYETKIMYEKNSTKKEVVWEIAKPATKETKTVYGIKTEEWTPTSLQIKPKAGGLWQQIWTSKS